MNKWTFDRELKMHSLPVDGENVEMIVYKSAGGDYVLTAQRSDDPCGGDVEYYDTLPVAKREAERAAQDGRWQELVLE